MPVEGERSALGFQVYVTDCLCVCFGVVMACNESYCLSDVTVSTGDWVHQGRGVARALWPVPPAMAHAMARSSCRYTYRLVFNPIQIS